MHAAEIRRRFLDYFARHQHVVRASSSLVPGDDPTLLFTNAGMVQFKKVFLGLEDAPEGRRRATTSQKCVRAGGKHNDLEQVGHTARHHTFFEMLGNFSFGDYFKRDAIRFAWEFVTGDVGQGNLGIPKAHVRVSVFHEDDEARAIWRETTNLPDSRIYGLGAADNFWQMADTGPCGPCSEIYVDLAHLSDDFGFPEGASGEWTERDRTEFSREAFVEGAEAGRFLEIWNLVFMQFDRQADGTMVPLPRPSVDTGAGLERIAAVMQRVSNNFHTDVFTTSLALVARVVGAPYHYPDERSASYRVIADHARAVAFLLADGVFPSNEGRGYVLRRILRRAVRHAWLLGRREPTLTLVVDNVIAQMRDVYPELHVRHRHLVETTRAEEERFLATIDGGMARFEELTPLSSTQGSTPIRGTLSGDDAFRLYDTFGFPIDLTELMARERGYVVDISGFESALSAQRERSQEERKGRRLNVSADELASGWTVTGTTDAGPPGPQRFVGYDTIEIETVVTDVRQMGDGRAAVILRDTPFYAESGGQIADSGEVVGQGWRLDVDDVKRVNGRIAAIGVLSGAVTSAPVVARVPARRRRDTERNHTATHLLHAALRHVLGEHVHQAGSVVEPDRLRFDFTHHGPLRDTELDAVEQWVNDAIWQGVDVTITERTYADAVARGAMALFGEKYGDVVRMVDVAGYSTELCGGCHVTNTGHIGAFRLVSEGGVSAGVRRIVALTGPKAFELMRGRERALESLSERLKINVQNAGPDVVAKRIDQLLADKRTLEKRLDESLRGGGGSGSGALTAAATAVGAHRLLRARVAAPDLKTLQGTGDAVRGDLANGIGVLGATFEEGKGALLVVVGDALREKGVSAADLIRAFAAATGARGGGKPHMAQAGVASDALESGLDVAHTLARDLLERLA